VVANAPGLISVEVARHGHNCGPLQSSSRFGWYVAPVEYPGRGPWSATVATCRDRRRSHRSESEGPTELTPVMVHPTNHPTTQLVRESCQMYEFIGVEHVGPTSYGERRRSKVSSGVFLTRLRSWRARSASMPLRFDPVDPVSKPTIALQAAGRARGSHGSSPVLVSEPSRTEAAGRVRERPQGPGRISRRHPLSAVGPVGAPGVVDSDGEK
jgi:hypothetical protein